ncbi:uncharacterized protein B0H18DRAFT_1116502 [Fomitopsis serialis]|uniref:uncharacterized protein n=1 Tax=Fomitopsis serialis TaxID=139415 RepID=UPI002007708A|nr:uncharacterized protein B0H18DRAFT_1116502 [Neoantrodia serialis]KAH9931346.1 hypothetical protein B0H18DRAFT_1116502 [Neoantrodia serialis]
MPTCPGCAEAFSNERVLTKHKKKCRATLDQARIAWETEQQREAKRRRVNDDTVSDSGSNVVFRTARPDSASNPPRGALLPGQDHPVLQPHYLASADADTVAPTLDLPMSPAHEPEADPAPRRSTRTRIMTQKVRDMLPESSGSGLLPLEESSAEAPEPEVRLRPRVRLIVMEKFRTIANQFGLSRLYKGRPSTVPDAELDVTSCLPADKPSRHAKTRRTISEIIAPLPNLSAWRQYHHFWSYPMQTRASRAAMQEIQRQPDFSSADAAAANYDKVDAILTAKQPWTDAAEGWRQASITIGIPSGHRSTEASRRSEYTARQRIRRHEPVEEVPAEHSVAGDHFTIPAFFYQPLVPLIDKVFGQYSISRNFHYHPFNLTYLPPDAPTGSLPENVHGELYTSKAWLNAEFELQNSPRVEGCDLPRAIVAMMFYSDSTNLAQFGNAKAWPIYIFFGNQSKYDRARPATAAGYHIAYLPSVSLSKAPSVAAAELFRQL